MGEFESAQQKHLRQIPQAELVPQPAEHDLKDDIRWELEIVERSARSFVGLASAVATSKDSVAQIGGTVQVLGSGRLAMRADHEQRVGLQK